MSAKRASLFFVAVCIGICFLSLTGVISPLVGGGIFAGALVFFGGFSMAFRRKQKMEEEEARSLEEIDA